MSTLLDYQYRDHWKAQRAQHGMGANKTGKSSDDVYLPVPPGTVIQDADTGELLGELVEPDETLLVARGGRGGRGNARFATPTHQAPREWEPGEEGEGRRIRLILKLIADVGLLGEPNAGKSTLLAALSAARPKIADYPFTTLQPNLGVVALGDETHPLSFVVADIPGLIEGAHEGAGLGTQFLRHIERTRLLVHLVDVSDASGRPDPAADFEVIVEELASFGAGLEKKPMLVAATKLDVANKDKLAKLKRHCKKRKLALFPISAVTGEGIDKLKYAVGEQVQKLRRREQKEAAEQATL
jgi:GTP-binding protein